MLVVDATQGVEAQTLANAYLAIDNNLDILPVINKIDLPSAEPERVREQIEHVIGLDAHDAVLASAKNGHRHRRDPREDRHATSRRRRAMPDAPLRALLFDSWYDSYRGVIVPRARRRRRRMRKRTEDQVHGDRPTYEVDRDGDLHAEAEAVDQLSVGEVGFFAGNIKDIVQAKIGDTITEANRRPPSRCPASRK